MASSEGSGSPLRTASTKAQHSTDKPNGPLESRECDNGITPSEGIRSAVGLKPVIPQKAEGIRMEPPVSVPMAATAMPSATDTPAPDDEPPGMRPVARSQGERGVP